MNNIDLLFNDLYKNYIVESFMSDEDKINLLYITELESGGQVFRTIKNILKFIKNLIVPFIEKNIILPIENKIRLKSIITKYNNIVSEYDKLKNLETPSIEDKQKLFNKISSIKQDIDEFNLVNKSSYIIQPGNENDSTISNISGSDSVGKVTNMIEQSSKVEWRKYWKSRCGNFTGIELNRCKAKGVDKALIDIQSKIKYCDNTIDPIGCKNTVSRLINMWKNKKLVYTSKR